MSNTDYLINFTEGQKIKATETNSNNQYILSQIDKRGAALEAYIKAEMDTFKDVVTSGSIKIGDCKIAFYDSVPAKFLVANGASLLISEYKALYDVIGAQYGQEDALHFNIPDLRNRVPEGFKDSTEAFGSFQAGTMPNITGRVGALCRGGDTGFCNVADGAFYSQDGPGWGPEQNGSAQYKLGLLNASRSSAVYKDGVKRATVDRVKVNYLIKYED